MAKKLISFVLILSLALTTTFAFADEWVQVPTGHFGAHMPYRPSDNYNCDQNPPDFSWPAIEGAVSYEVKVTTDIAREHIVHEAKDIPYNVYNFSKAFEPGIYYWSLRYKTAEGYSSWKNVGRFRIDKNAFLYEVGTIGEITSKIPDEHPRAYFNKGDVAKLRDAYRNTELKDNVDIKSIISTADSYVSGGFIKEPLEAPKGTFGAAHTTIINTNTNAASMIINCAMAYLITGDTKYADLGIEYMLELAKWKRDGDALSYYTVNDQGARDLIFKVAVAYDWLWECMTEEERAIILESQQHRITNRKGEGTESIMDWLKASYIAPYDSHTWSNVEYMVIAGYCYYGDIPEGKELLEVVLPLINGFLPPWSNEDGGWAQGTSYWGHSSSFNKMNATLLEHSGIMNPYNKAWSQNEPYGMLYLQLPGTKTVFGDEQNREVGSILRVLVSAAMHIDNPYSKWHRNNYTINWGSAGIILSDLVDDKTYTEEEAKVPYDLPLGRYFKDIGWTASHSSLVDRDKVSFYFKSSPYGSYSHSHNDQNHFVIDAFGERLAFDAGYYDGWGSTFDFGYTRQTYAHNAITHSNGAGQPTQNIMAKGVITDYLYTPTFDLSSGDATDSYNTASMEVGKVKRNMIYIRPDTFIVVDDLAAPEGEETTFEMWMQAETKMELYDNNPGLKITKGNAELDATVHYPHNIKSYYSDVYAGTDISQAYSKPLALIEQHKHAWFKTEPVQSTKIVTTMDVHRMGEGAQYVRSSEVGNVLKLEFEDGTIAYVKLNDDIANIDGYEFDADALLVKGEAYMFVGGTILKEKGKDIISSDVPVSLALDRSNLSISSILNDANVKVYLPELTKAEKVVDDVITNIEPGTESNLGINWNKSADGYVDFSLYNGTYNLLIGDAVKPGEAEGISSTLTVYDGNEVKTYPVTHYYDHFGNLISDVKPSFNGGFYRIDEISANIVTDIGKTGDEVILSDKLQYMKLTDTNDATIRLTPIDERVSVSYTPYEGFHDKIASSVVFAEAENYGDFLRKGFNKYNSRAFMSGGAGVTLLNEAGEFLEWELDVPEDGEYKVNIGYVAWMPEECVRHVSIGDLSNSFVCPITAGYGSVPEHWSVLTLDKSVSLKKGKNKLKVTVISGSMWNIDWIGLERAE